MASSIAIEITAQGVLIPRATIQNWGEIEVVQEDYRIIIQPKSLTSAQERELILQALREDGLLTTITDTESLSPPATPAERARLAKKLSKGRPLSEFVLEERQAGW
jgi:hypothetical protein